MSKEMFISSSPHETKLAVMEDDQLVEVYYERDTDVGLVGGIYKGRVSRVLPGMQSAFVDIGLDRDAFLYVSDFFEDNDEYDKVVSSVEEKVLKLEKGDGAPAPVSAPAFEPGPATGEPVAEAAASAEPAPRAVNGRAPVSAPEPRTGERDPRSDPRNDNRGDRRGHRSRRRRNRGGRGGLPESKYFSPRTRPEGPPAEVADASESVEEEFPVL